MRMASLHFLRLRPNQFEQDETWCPTECTRYAEINPGIPKLRYLWMSPAPISLKNSAHYPVPHQPPFGNTCFRVYYIMNQARYAYPSSYS